jgi:hypothetical protein
MVFSGIARSWGSCLRNHYTLRPSLNDHNTKTPSEKLPCWSFWPPDQAMASGIGNKEALHGQGFLTDSAQQ